MTGRIDQAGPKTVLHGARHLYLNKSDMYGNISPERRLSRLVRETHGFIRQGSKWGTQTVSHGARQT